MSCCKTLTQKLPQAKEHCHHNSNAHSEKNKRIEIKLPAGKSVCKVIVDGGLIANKQVEKCDCVFYICPDNHFVFVELKGVNWPKPLKQIATTIKYFKANVKDAKKGFKFEAIIIRGATPKANQKVRDEADNFAKEFKVVPIVRTNSYIHQYAKH